MRKEFYVDYSNDIYKDIDVIGNDWEYPVREKKRRRAKQPPRLTKKQAAAFDMIMSAGLGVLMGLTTYFFVVVLPGLLR